MDDDLKTLTPSLASPGALKLHKENPMSDSFEFQPSAGFLKKSRSQGAARFNARLGKRNREAVRFKPLGANDLSSDEDDEGDDFKSPLSAASETPVRPWLRQKVSMASTTPTLVGGRSEMDIDYEKDMAKLKQIRKNSAGLGEGEIPEYSDYEDDVAKSPPVSPRAMNAKEWSPGFINRHKGVSSSGSQRTTANTGSAASTSSPPRPPQLASVPATPSLIKAIDRIAVAQKDAYTGKSADGMPASGADEEQSGEKTTGIRWDDFWRDVREKAGTGN